MGFQSNLSIKLINSLTQICVNYKMTAEMTIFSSWTILGKKSDYFQLNSFWKKVIQGDYCLRCSTCFLVLGFWELNHVTFTKLRKKELLAKLCKFTKWQLFFTQNENLGLFWVKIVVILWIWSTLHAVLSFSEWEKSRDSTPNSQKLEDM